MLVAIIGAGPTGLHMAVELARNGIRYIVFEKGQVGQTIFNWPSHTRFHSAPEKIQIGGLLIQSDNQERLQRDAYLSYLRQVVDFYEVNVQPFEEVVSMEKENNKFCIHSRDVHGRRATYFFTHVIFATGTCHKPVVPSIPGIHLPHVKDINFPLHHVFRRKVLIIGGRHSALEYAVKACRIGASGVSISSRTDPFEVTQLKKEMLDDVRKMADRGSIRMFTPSLVTSINDNGALVHNTVSAKETQVPAHWIIIACGYATSFKMFRQLGISQAQDNGAPQVDEQTMETNVQGAYVIGTATAGSQQSQYEYFIENTLGHVEKVSAHIQKALVQND